jgi:hypothetical protein
MRGSALTKPYQGKASEHLANHTTLGDLTIGEGSSVGISEALPSLLVFLPRHIDWTPY